MCSFRTEKTFGVGLRVDSVATQSLVQVELEGVRVQKLGAEQAGLQRRKASRSVGSGRDETLVETAGCSPMFTSSSS